MKRITSAFLLTLVLSFSILFTGCGIVLRDNLDLDKSYTLTASLKYGAESEILMKLSRTSSGEWSCSVNEPFALQGLSIIYSSGSITLSRDGMSVQPSSKGISGAALMIDALESGISSVSDNSAAAVGSGIEISGTNQNGGYVLTLDRESLLPVSVSVSEHNLSVIFTEVTVSEFETHIINDFEDFADFED